MGAEPSRGSELCAPTCSLGKTRTPAGETFYKSMAHAFTESSTGYVGQIQHPVTLDPHFI